MTELHRRSRRRRPHVLVLESDSANRKLLCWTLRTEGYRITEAGDGVALNEIDLRAGKVDLVIAEADTLGIRRVPCPLILMTSSLSASMRQRARSLGASCSVHRPIYVDELKQAVASTLARSPRQPSRPYPTVPRAVA